MSADGCAPKDIIVHFEIARFWNPFQNREIIMSPVKNSTFLAGSQFFERVMKPMLIRKLKVLVAIKIFQSLLWVVVLICLSSTAFGQSKHGDIKFGRKFKVGDQFQLSVERLFVRLISDHNWLPQNQRPDGQLLVQKFFLSGRAEVTGIDALKQANQLIVTIDEFIWSDSMGEAPDFVANSNAGKKIRIQRDDQNIIIRDIDLGLSASQELLSSEMLSNSISEAFGVVGNQYFVKYPNRRNEQWGLSINETFVGAISGIFGIELNESTIEGTASDKGVSDLSGIPCHVLHSNAQVSHIGNKQKIELAGEPVTVWQSVKGMETYRLLVPVDSEETHLRALRIRDCDLTGHYVGRPMDGYEITEKRIERVEVFVSK